MSSKSDKTTYGSPAYVIGQIIGFQPRGTYVFAMPAALINSTIAALNGSPNPAPVIASANYNQYIVMSIADGQTAFTAYNDNIWSAKMAPARAIFLMRCILSRTA